MLRMTGVTKKRVMKIAIAFVVVALLIAASPTAAQDAYSAQPNSGEQAKPLPFPRSDRAQVVWEGGQCWSECGSYCAWGMAACLTRDAQANCLPLGDTCDRYCQRQCRTRGGPFLGFID